jgi:hypothetical protein
MGFISPNSMSTNPGWTKEETYGFKDLEARCEATKDECTDCLHINSEVLNNSTG